MNSSLKEFVRDLAHFTPHYRAARAGLEETFTLEKLRRAVAQAIAHVPYYQSHGYANLLPSGTEEFDITKFPIITKEDVIGHEEELVSDRFFKCLLRQEKTGGSSGRSMKLFYSPTLSFARTAQPDILYDRYVGKPFKAAMLRGNRPVGGQISQRIGPKRLVLSSYLMSDATIDTYLNIIRDEGITCLLAYPSSITVFAHLIRDRYGVAELPTLKAIMTSSEIFARADKELVTSVFPNVTVIDYYSMSEFATAAYSIGMGNYEFNFNYGYVEFIDTGDRTPASNKICEIVATSVMNDTMPLIRYATADYAELDADGNVINIIGRTSDYAVNKSGKLSPCIVVFSKAPMLKVLQFQYYQDTPGKVEFHVIPKGDDFNEEDRLTLVHDMEQSFAGAVDCDVKVVTELEKTHIGKLRRMVQRLDLSQYKK